MAKAGAGLALLLAPAGIAFGVVAAVAIAIAVAQRRKVQTEIAIGEADRKIAALNVEGRRLREELEGKSAIADGMRVEVQGARAVVEKERADYLERVNAAGGYVSSPDGFATFDHYDETGEWRGSDNNPEPDGPGWRVRFRAPGTPKMERL